VSSETCASFPCRKINTNLCAVFPLRFGRQCSYPNCIRPSISYPSPSRMKSLISSSPSANCLNRLFGRTCIGRGSPGASITTHRITDSPSRCSDSRKALGRYRCIIEIGMVADCIYLVCHQHAIRCYRRHLCKESGRRQCPTDFEAACTLLRVPLRNLLPQEQHRSEALSSLFHGTYNLHQTVLLL